MTAQQLPAQPDGLPVLHPRDTGEWEAWLRAHHTAPGAWVQLAKKGTTEPGIRHPQAVEVALCFGWIDSVARRLDDQWTLQRFTPRRPRSPWSAVNRRAAEALIAAGRMHESGLRAVDVARANGRWEAAFAPQE